MSHRLSSEDVEFRNAFEQGRIGPDAFGHRAHIRLAYVYLVGSSTEDATDRMRGALRTFMARNRIDATKYHETMTRAWVLAVRHFMSKTEESESADAFIDVNPIMLDSGIMLSHYSAGLLFSDEARAEFVEPNLDPIPRHD